MAVTRVAVIWQRFLPYHHARLNDLGDRLAHQGIDLFGVEVAAQDSTYGFPDVSEARSYNKATIFSDSYHRHSAGHVHRLVYDALCKIEPDLILAPATPFPEGMSAIQYASRRKARVVVMDDAWSHTDRRGWLTRLVKRRIHRFVDGVLLPAQSHLSHHQSLGFKADEAFYGLDVVSNEELSKECNRVRRSAESIRVNLHLPEKYFLVVSRILAGKGLNYAIDAYLAYRESCPRDHWKLVIVGDGPGAPDLHKSVGDDADILLVGAKFGKELVAHYALAGCFIMPSDNDTWGLVVNEALACRLPVIVSRGCGACKTLVIEGKNGWTFSVGDTAALSRHLRKIATLSDSERRQMQQRSGEIIEKWPLRRFSDSAMEMLDIRRKPRLDILAWGLVFAWKGHITSW